LPAYRPIRVALRDRAVLATMACTFGPFARCSSFVSKTIYVQGRHGWLRLHKKGGKVNELPYHYTLQQFLDGPFEAAKIADDPEEPLFRTWRSAALQRRELDQSSVDRRLRQAGIGSGAGNRSFRATGITNYLKNGGKLELAQRMAAPARARPLCMTGAGMGFPWAKSKGFPTEPPDQHDTGESMGFHFGRTRYGSSACDECGEPLRFRMTLLQGTASLYLIV
jgi:hypothetical protein